ncbi:MAG: CaiB/BaiF CoA transferase family protein [Oliverpabstia sp.]
MSPKPLKGITIVEMGTQEAEGIAGLLLSDYGADVIRLEFSQKGEDKSALRICDRGKRRVLFRPEDEEDRKWLRKLLMNTDAVVTSVPEPQMAQWQMDGDTLCSLYPGLVYTSVSGYGQNGPYAEREYDEAVIQAESGFMSVTGPEHGEPIRCGGDFAVFAGAANACIATLMALIDAHRTGKGRKIDVSMMDSVLFGMENQYSVYLKSGKVPKPKGNHYALSAPVGDYPCKDGQRLMISVATEAQWKNFAEVLGHEEWLKDPDYRNVSERVKNQASLGKKVSAAFMEYTSDELIKMLQTRSCVYGRINHFDDVVRHPQAAARNMFVEIQVPGGQKITVPSNPIMMDGAKSTGIVINDTIPCQKWHR